jgi:hypothetical protein
MPQEPNQHEENSENKPNISTNKKSDNKNSYTGSTLAIGL